MAEKEVRLIDANALESALEATPIAAAAIKGKMFRLIEDAPTIDPESLKNNKRMIPLNEVYRVIAGHSNYSGDAILSALTCIAEGKDVKPVKPLENLRPHGKWVHDINNLYGCDQCGERETMSPKKLKDYYPNCGAKMDKED